LARMQNPETLTMALPFVPAKTSLAIIDSPRYIAAVVEIASEAKIAAGLYAMFTQLSSRIKE